MICLETLRTIPPADRISTLDQISRTRALTDQESDELYRAIRSEQTIAGRKRG